jgi:hypothetical protein
MANSYNFREKPPAPTGMGPKILRHLKVEKGTAGGHVVTHVFEYNHGPGRDHPDEAYPFGDGQGAEVLAHIAKHLGIKAAAAPAKMAKPPAGGNALE